MSDTIDSMSEHDLAAEPKIPAKRITGVKVDPVMTTVGGLYDPLQAKIAKLAKDPSKGMTETEFQRRIKQRETEHKLAMASVPVTVTVLGKLIEANT